jgi:hypothetical protein
MGSTIPRFNYDDDDDDDRRHHHHQQQQQIGGIPERDLYNATL